MNATPSKPDGAVKYDAGKPPVFKGVLSYFPKSIAYIAAISEFGSRKYAWGGWKHLDDSFTRYSDAMVRHLLAEGEGTTVDNDSGFLHAGHAAWGALARLEILLNEKEKTETP